MYWLLPHLLSSLTHSLPSLNLLCHSKNWFLIYARWSKNSLKHSIPFCGLFPILKHNFIAYHSSKVSSRPDCIFEIHQLWQSGFSWVYSNCCCSYLFEPEIIKLGQSSHKIYSNKILNFQESTPILNACTIKSGNLLKAPFMLNSDYCNSLVPHRSQGFRNPIFNHANFPTDSIGKGINPLIPELVIYFISGLHFKSLRQF